MNFLVILLLLWIWCTAPGKVQPTVWEACSNHLKVVTTHIMWLLCSTFWVKISLKVKARGYYACRIRSSTAQLPEPPLHFLQHSMSFPPKHSSWNLHCMSYCLPYYSTLFPKLSLHVLLPSTSSPLLRILCLALHPGSYLSPCSCCLTLLECHLRCLYH